ncbi:MAG TPA: VWA domain-containing protein [Thiotrichaceae bacterium]|jgi:Ca-activated chloride channel family protein|nr:VWA domain-containing protein [Thiotrichaceae bacterium]HIM07012.1 VWA domain-containing protein [Gammaproteobacteria bacterium]
MTEFHFIRPYWFIAIIPVAFILWKLAKRHLINKHWESVCDPELLPYILVGKSGQKKITNIVLAALVFLLIIIALAGPSWERLPQPVFQKESALVIALDLSLSMYADDIKPNRLERARFKIADLLKLRQEGQTALLVYAGDAFTVTPLTDDIKTINSLLTSLSPAIMPALGSNTDIALTKSVELLKQAGISQGHILLVSDEVELKYESNFIRAKESGYQVSILGLGTEGGAPVSMGESGFLKDRAGTIVIPKLNQKVLSQLANAGGGYYETSQIADGDIERLNHLFNSGLESDSETETEFKTDQWHEFGPWLVLFILPIVAFGFRRGYLAILICLMISSPDDAMAFEWNDLWLNENQKAMRALENEQATVASDLFQDNEWKAAAKYKAGDYAAAEELLNEYQDERSLYNKGNSLAKQGRYEDAITAYDQALENNPENQDAKFNKELVEKELEKQQPSQSDENSNEKSEQDSEKNEDQQSDQEQQNSEPGGEQQSDSQSEQQQNEQDEQESSEQQADKNEAEEEKKQEMKRQAEEESKEDENKEQEQQTQKEMNELDEEQQAAEQWLRRIPDDPSGLLRRKFKYQYQQQKQKSSTNEKYW